MKPATVAALKVTVAGFLAVLVVRELLLRPGSPATRSPPLSGDLWFTAVAVGHDLSRAVAAVPELIEFSDYECPACRRAHRSVDSAVVRGMEIRYVHYPLPNHPMARGAALVAICANRQGKFDAVHEVLMVTDEWRTSGDWEAIAARARVPNLDAFRGCLASPTATEDLDRHIATARAAGVRATPTFASQFGTAVGARGTDSLIDLARPRGQRNRQ